MFSSNTTRKNTHGLMIKKIRVAVLLGGRSNEKEISLESGRNVVYKLSPQKYEALPMFVNTAMHLYHITNQQLVLNSTKEIEKSLVPEQKIAMAHAFRNCRFCFHCVTWRRGRKWLRARCITNA